VLCYLFHQHSEVIPSACNHAPLTHVLTQEVDPHVEDLAEALRLTRIVHVQYLHHGLGQLPSGFACLDASRPWIVYWIVHSLTLLGAGLPGAPGPIAADVVSFLKCCQSPSGGFGGSPKQIPHLAPSYAAVCALMSLGGEAALGAVDRQAMFDFLCRMAIDPSQGGGFSIHEGGAKFEVGNGETGWAFYGLNSPATCKEKFRLVCAQEVSCLAA